jgi:hypothetical protein
MLSASFWKSTTPEKLFPSSVRTLPVAAPEIWPLRNAVMKQAWQAMNANLADKGRNEW